MILPAISLCAPVTFLGAAALSGAIVGAIPHMRKNSPLPSSIAGVTGFEAGVFSGAS